MKPTVVVCYSQDRCSYSLYFGLNILFQGRKVTGTFEKRAPGDHELLFFLPLPEKSDNLLLKVFMHLRATFLCLLAHERLMQEKKTGFF